MPAILRMKDGGYRVLIMRLPDGRFRLGNPLIRSAQDETAEALSAAWDGEIILVTRRWAGANPSPTATPSACRSWRPARSTARPAMN